MRPPHSPIPYCENANIALVQPPCSQHVHRIGRSTPRAKAHRHWCPRARQVQTTRAQNKNIKQFIWIKYHDMHWTGREIFSISIIMEICRFSLGHISKLLVKPKTSTGAGRSGFEWNREPWVMMVYVARLTIWPAEGHANLPPPPTTIMHRKSSPPVSSDTAMRWCVVKYLHFFLYLLLTAQFNSVAARCSCCTILIYWPFQVRSNDQKYWGWPVWKIYGNRSRSCGA